MACISSISGEVLVHSYHPAIDKSHEGCGPSKMALLYIAGNCGLSNLIIQLLEGTLDGREQLMVLSSWLAIVAEDSGLPAPEAQRAWAALIPHSGGQPLGKAGLRVLHTQVTHLHRLRRLVHCNTAIKVI